MLRQHNGYHHIFPVENRGIDLDPHNKLLALNEQPFPNPSDQFQYWEWKVMSLKLLTEKMNIPVAQKLRLFVEEWKSLCGNPWVTELIIRGMDPDFICIPGKNRDLVGRQPKVGMKT